MWLCRNEDKATGYKPGMWACIATALLTIILVGFLSVVFRLENKMADRGEKELETSDVRTTESFLKSVVFSGAIANKFVYQEDYQPGFRYTI